VSTRSKQRLAKVEQALTPKQAVIAFLRDRVRKFHNVMDYLAANRRLPIDELPRPKICRRVAESVRSRLQGQGVPEGVIRRSVRDATMDADFLLALTMVCNQVPLDDRTSNRLRLALFAEGLRFMLFRQSVAKSVGKTAGGRHGLKVRGAIDDEEIEEWSQAVAAFAADLYRIKEAVRLIERRYFDETPVLLGEMNEELSEQIGGDRSDRQRL
jgi:hypothetical protein